VKSWHGRCPVSRLTRSWQATAEQRVRQLGPT